MILTKSHVEETTFILTTITTIKVPFKFFRQKFPLKLAFIMTINKSQDQYVKHSGVDLQTPMLFHSQLYVALSWTTSIHLLKVLSKHVPKTMNIVYSKVLI